LIYRHAPQRVDQSTDLLIGCNLMSIFCQRNSVLKLFTTELAALPLNNQSEAVVMATAAMHQSMR
jgi:hypothetical protein